MTLIMVCMLFPDVLIDSSVDGNLLLIRGVRAARKYIVPHILPLYIQREQKSTVTHAWIGSWIGYNSNRKQKEQKSKHRFINIGQLGVIFLIISPAQTSNPTEARCGNELRVGAMPLPQTVVFIQSEEYSGKATHVE